MKIFYDVDTQNDFMNKDGALYVPDAELIKSNLALLTNYAIKNRIPIVGSVDKHFGTSEYKEREGELARWGGPFPDHCMNGTFGQRKIKETGFFWKGIDGAPEPVLTEYDDAIYIENNLNRKVDRPELGRALGVIAAKLPKGYNPEAYKHGLFFEKQSYDVFTNPQLEVFLKMADVKEAVVYGVATDFCVKAAVLGMQARTIQCYVVEDAIRGVFPDKTQQALEEMAKAGAKLIATKDVLEGKI